MVVLKSSQKRELLVVSWQGHCLSCQLEWQHQLLQLQVVVESLHVVLKELHLMVLAEVRLEELVLQDVVNVQDLELMVVINYVVMNVVLIIMVVVVYQTMVMWVKVAHPNLHEVEVEHSSGPSRKEENSEHLGECSGCTLESSSSPLVVEA